MKKTFLLLSMALCGLSANAQEEIVFERNDDIANALNMKAKNAMPIVADMNNDGLMDVFFSGEGYDYMWRPTDSISTETGETVWDWKWDWANNSFIAIANQDQQTWSTKKDQWPCMYQGGASRAFDYDQDGDVDYLLVDYMGQGWGNGPVEHPWTGWYTRIRLIQNHGDTTYTEVPNDLANIKFQEHFNAKKYLHAITIADINQDGYPDLAIMSELSDPWSRGGLIFLNNGDGTGFTQVEDPGLAPYSGGRFLVTDFDGDGHVDIVAHGWCDGRADIGVNGGYRFDFYRGNGTGKFTLANTELFSEIDGACKYAGNGDGGENAIHLIDFNQDGKLDFFISGSVVGMDPMEGENKVAVAVINNSTPGKFSFAEEHTYIYPSSANNENLSILADFNGDGYPDYLCSGWNGDWHWGNFSSSEGALGMYSTSLDMLGNGGLGLPLDGGLVNFGDINHDGMLDLITPNNSDNDAPVVYLNFAYREDGDDLFEAPDAPENVAFVYDEEAKTLTVTWDATANSFECKSIYNLFLKSTTGRRMLVPALEENGKQQAYLCWENYVPTNTYTFYNVEKENYVVGVQSVDYGYRASEFTSIDVVLDEDKPVVGIDVVEVANKKEDNTLYTISGMVASPGAKGLFIQNGKKVVIK